MSGKSYFDVCQLTICDEGADVKTLNFVEITNLGFLIAKLSPLRILGHKIPFSAIKKLGDVLRNNSTTKPMGAHGIIDDGLPTLKKIKFEDCCLTISEDLIDLNTALREITDLGFLIAKFNPLEIRGTNISNSNIRKLVKVLSSQCLPYSDGDSSVEDEDNSQKDQVIYVKKTSPTPTPQCPLNVDESFSDSSTSRRKLNEFDGSQTTPKYFVGSKTQLRVYVTKLDITKVDADAIVNSSDRILYHKYGVAQAIASAAGPSLVNECNVHIKTHILLDVTDVFVSTGGLLKAKYVFHAVGPKWEVYEDKNKLTIDLRRTVLRCLVEASRLNLDSIALPSLCAVALKLTKEEMAQCYMEAVKYFDNFADGLSVVPVKRILFVDINDILVETIQNQFMKEWDKPVDTVVSQKDLKFAKQHIVRRNGNFGQDKQQKTHENSYQSVSQANATETSANKLPVAATQTTGIISPVAATITTAIIAPSAATHLTGIQVEKETATDRVLPKNTETPIETDCNILTTPQNTAKDTKSYPTDVDMRCSLSDEDVSGLRGKGSIVINYKISRGIQTDLFSPPGRSVPLLKKTAYLPATEEGFEALRLLRIAFLRHLIFKFHVSDPSGITWNIQHKTSRSNSPHGYPDPTYLMTLMKELKENGVSLKSMTEEEENLSLSFVQDVMKTAFTRS